MFPSNTKILIIDDMGTMRKIVMKSLQNMGFTDITEADDGATAWPIFQTAATSGKPFQLIISDWNMPKMTGIQLLKNVRAHEAGKKIPFVMLTAETESNNVVEAVTSGVSNYIIKPFTPDSFKAKIEQTWKKVGGK